MEKWFLIIFLFVLTLFFIFITYKTNKSSSYYLTIVSLLTFCIFYSTEVLNYKIGGNYFSLEKRISKLSEDQEELKHLTKSLLKIIYIVKDGARYFDGPTEEHQDLIEKHLKDISEYVDPKFEIEIKNEINDLTNKIKNK